MSWCEIEQFVCSMDGVLFIKWQKMSKLNVHIIAYLIPTFQHDFVVYLLGA